MTNYGHAIRTGVEIVGAPNDPATSAELSALAEQIGYDVVVLPDQQEGGGHDATTLATWVSARTSTVGIVPRLQAADRPASIVARTTSSLQLLSGNRAAIAIETDSATGDVGSVEDAVAVIRSLHDTSGPSRVSHHGAHHRLAGAEPGPSLERGVPIWLAGSAAATAAVSGRVADGWMVDLGEVGVDDISELNDVLDAEAIGAGRDPREVRRAVVSTIDAAVDIDALVSLVVGSGVSLLVLRVDAAAGTDVVAPAMRTFAAISASVRARVEEMLPSNALSARPVRRKDALARRRAAIAYDEVPEDLAEGAVEPGDPAFARLRSTYLRGGSPGILLRPTTVSEVSSAVTFARKHQHLPLGIRSGGHGISGRSTNDGGLVIDVGGLDDITVLDPAERLVRIGPGARWRDVATALQTHGWALSSGDYGGVGVGGLATTGGIGFLNRKHGLTIDHLRAVEMVLADGTRVRASDSENTELFWAVRGAGANFGIAVAFEFEVDEVAEIGWAQLAFQVSDPADFLEMFGRVVLQTPRDTTPFLVLGQGMAQIMAMVDSSDPATIIDQLQPFADIAPLADQQVAIAPYASVMNMFPASAHNGRGEPVSRSAFTRYITPEFASASADLIRSGASHWYQIRTVGGAVSDVATDDTAYAHRDANFALTVMGSNAQRLDRWFDPVRRESDGLYLSFESDSSPDRINDAFPPATLERLRRLKTQIDPQNLFRDNFNITPAHHTMRSA
ncbi:FAD linked oxidase domain-containing protein [Gordonia terrae C-6]|uniref:FAD linked oxidase domain-containing protein n=1 Tax=Gordonia terrae C-6 TaxID=1316928 RepID=R7YB34_9ACTN|nr:FAD linked oxidase domain-containing protein [Gordonia terrae C-6]